jgi:hypothetical protein
MPHSKTSDRRHSLFDPNHELVAAVLPNIPKLAWQLLSGEWYLGLQYQDGVERALVLQLGYQRQKRLEPTFKVRKRRTEEKSNRFERRLPALGPMIHIATDDAGPIGDMECLEVFLNLVGDANVAFDEEDMTGATAERLQADRSRAREEIEERAARDGVPQDAKERLAHHLRGGSNLWIYVNDKLPATQLAGHDPKLSPHKFILATDEHG